MYIAIVYGTSPVINCAVYKDFGSDTAHALQTPPQRQASTLNRIAMQTPYLGLAKRDHLEIYTQIPKNPKTPSRPFWSVTTSASFLRNQLQAFARAVLAFCSVGLSTVSVDNFAFATLRLGPRTCHSFHRARKMDFLSCHPCFCICVFHAKVCKRPFTVQIIL